MFLKTLNIRKKHIFAHTASIGKGEKMKVEIKIDLKINLSNFELEEKIKNNEKSREVVEEEFNEGLQRAIENMYDSSVLADIDEIVVKHSILM